MINENICWDIIQVDSSHMVLEYARKNNSLYADAIRSFVKSRFIYSIVFLSAIFLLMVSSCEENRNQKDLATQTQLQRQLVRYIDSCWNNQNIKVLGQITNGSFIRNLNGIRVAKSSIEMEAHMKVFFRCLPPILKFHWRKPQSRKAKYSFSGRLREPIQVSTERLEPQEKKLRSMACRSSISTSWDYSYARMSILTS